METAKTTTPNNSRLLVTQTTQAPEAAQARELAEANPESQKLARRATGPRTERGKERSKLNATKHGIFSRAVLIAGESHAAYQSLLRGLQEDRQPQGYLEVMLVEQLAITLWRKRRLLKAESAEIALASEFIEHETYRRQMLEAKQLQDGRETLDKEVRSLYNPLSLGSWIGKLEELRALAEKRGLNPDADLRVLEEIYGCSPPVGAPATEAGGGERCERHERCQRAEMRSSWQAADTIGIGRVGT